MIAALATPALASDDYVLNDWRIDESRAIDTRVCFSVNMSGDGIRHVAMEGVASYDFQIAQIHEPTNVGDCNVLTPGDDYDLRIGWGPDDGNIYCGPPGPPGLAGISPGGDLDPGGFRDYAIMSMDKDCLDNGQLHVSMSTPVPSSKYDWLTIVRHEVGHALGLDHDDTGGLMDGLSPGQRKGVSGNPENGVRDAYDW
jgi:hypothetical protein